MKNTILFEKTSIQVLSQLGLRKTQFPENTFNTKNKYTEKHNFQKMFLEKLRKYNPEKNIKK